MGVKNSVVYLKSFLGSKNNKRVLKSILWQITDKVIKLFGGAIVGIIVARYLGPENFGILNFSYSYAWLFASIATLGLDEIAVRELIRKIHPPQKIAGTTLLLKIGGSLLASIFIVAGMAFMPQQSNLYRWLILIMTLSMILRTTGTTRLWFEANLLSRQMLIIENAAFIICVLLRILFVILQKSLYHFAVVFALEYILTTIFYLIAYSHQKIDIRHWKWDKNLAKELLASSWPLIIAGVSIMIYMKSDIVLLGILANEKEVGIYAAAVRLSEMWYMVPNAIMMSLFPTLISLRKQSAERYFDRLQTIFDSLVLIALVISIVMTFLSGPIIGWLYGVEFSESGKVLAVHIWSGVFVFLGVASSKHLTAENLVKTNMYRTLIGAGLNIVLNLFFIPAYGATGAAVSTIIAYFISVYSAYFFKETRFIGIMLFRSLNPVHLIKGLNSYLTKSSL